MAKRAGGSASPPPTLLVPRDQLAETLRKRIAAGRKLLRLTIADEEELAEVWRAQEKWDRYNREMLRQSFSGTTLLDEYPRPTSGDGEARDFEDLVLELDADQKEALSCLESILERLDLFPDAAFQPTSALPADGREGTRVFIVHGHDDAARETVARFVGHLGLEPVILHEVASGGRTILEKLLHQSDVAFAVVLLTPDDVGHPKAHPDKKEARARQNVILELGYFLGRLDRSRVCALYAEGVALPSDYDGVVYVPLDAAGAWRMKLAREFKAAGLPVDGARLLSA